MSAQVLPTRPPQRQAVGVHHLLSKRRWGACLALAEVVDVARTLRAGRSARAADIYFWGGAARACTAPMRSHLAQRRLDGRRRLANTVVADAVEVSQPVDAHAVGRRFRLLGATPRRSPRGTPSRTAWRHNAPNAPCARLHAQHWQRCGRVHGGQHMRSPHGRNARSARRHATLAGQAGVEGERTGSS